MNNLIIKNLETVKRICQQYNVPWELCVVQASLESGKGTNKLGKVFNFWGMKFRPKRFPKIHKKSIKKLTFEFIKQKKIKIIGTFVAFDSFEEGVTGWCEWMTHSNYDIPSNYPQSIREMFEEMLAQDPVRFMAWRWANGYATAPRYIQALVARSKRVSKKLKMKELEFEIDDEMNESLFLMRHQNSKKEVSSYILPFGYFAFTEFLLKRNKTDVV